MELKLTLNHQFGSVLALTSWHPNRASVLMQRQKDNGGEAAGPVKFINWIFANLDDDLVFRMPAYL